MQESNHEQEYLAIEREMDDVAERIRDWDRENIADLYVWLEEAGQIANELGYETGQLLRARGVWVDDLPSEPIPEELTGYPVWAIDRYGRALVGDKADKIEDLEEVIEWMDYLRCKYGRKNKIYRARNSETDQDENSGD